MKRMSRTVIGFIFGILVAFTLDVAAETLIDSRAVSYSNSKTTETTVNGALNELFSTVDINEKIGDMAKIADIGDGTIAGAINSNLGQINSLNTSVSSINTSLSGKQATITGGASTITNSNLAANMALISNGSGKVAASSVTSTELGYLDGVTSNVQTQINALNNISFENKNAHGYLSDLNNLDKSKNYCGLITISNTDGRQGFFIQFGGIFSIQMIFINLEDTIMWRIAYGGKDWSSVAWQEK